MPSVANLKRFKNTAERSLVLQCSDMQHFYVRTVRVAQSCFTEDLTRDSIAWLWSVLITERLLNHAAEYWKIESLLQR